MLAACGGSGNSASSSSESSPSPSPSPSKAANLTVTDACSLVSATDASTAVGTTVTNLAGGASVPGACFYASSDGSSGVLIFAQAYPDATTADNVQPNQMAAAFQAQYGITNARSVAGIGDKAFEYTVSSQTGSPGIAIFVFKTNIVMFILMTPSTDSNKIEALARTAVGNLHS